jgi:hypothetical protein
MNANEILIIKSIIEYTIAKGFVMSINDGEEDTVDFSNDKSFLLMSLDTTGEDYLFFHDGLHQLGWMRFIYGNGNDGLDVICDSSITDYITELEINAIPTVGVLKCCT